MHECKGGPRAWCALQLRWEGDNRTPERKPSSRRDGGEIPRGLLTRWLWNPPPPSRRTPGTSLNSRSILEPPFDSYVARTTTTSTPASARGRERRARVRGAAGKASARPARSVTSRLASIRALSGRDGIGYVARGRRGHEKRQRRVLHGLRHDGRSSAGEQFCPPERPSLSNSCLTVLACNASIIVMDHLAPRRRTHLLSGQCKSPFN